jgi:hypothetical protein
MLRVKATVQIIGVPVACSEGIKDSWREAAAWAAAKLHDHFGEAVKVEYYDLFDPSCPAFPNDAQIPVVLINSVCFSSGGKISVPAIRKYLEGPGG